MKLPRCNFLHLAASSTATRLMLVLLALAFADAASAQSLTPEERQALSPDRQTSRGALSWRPHECD